MRSISSKLSTISRPTGRPSSSTDLLFPCRTIASGGTPAAVATACSPAVEHRMPSPHSCASRAMATTGNAFTANSPRDPFGPEAIAAANSVHAARSESSS